MRRDMIDHKGIMLISFLNNGSLNFLINIYSDAQHTAINFLTNSDFSSENLIYMGGDFNVHDRDWNPTVVSHPIARQMLVDLADNLGLVRSLPTTQVPTHYTPNEN